MKRPQKKVAVSLFLLIALLALGVAVQARTFTGAKTAVAETDAVPVVSIELSPAEQEAALAFWTRERIKAAKPMEMPKQAGPAEVDRSAQALPELEGPYGFVTSGLAAPDADRIAKAAYPQDWLEVEGLDGVGAPDAVGPDAF
ncbi:MAG: hypothetical protein N2383_11450, partial [Caldilineales bacterium]|nr:hypothetical protein [Caldilineales bacterium]